MSNSTVMSHYCQNTTKIKLNLIKDFKEPLTRLSYPFLVNVDLANTHNILSHLCYCQTNVQWHRHFCKEDIENFFTFC